MGRWSGGPEGQEATLSYLIAAYAIVVGSLVAYGLWIQVQRRRLAREIDAGRPEAAGVDAPPARRDRGA